MKEIKLTQGFVTQVDDRDYEYLNQFNWHISRGKYAIYCIRHVRLGKWKYKGLLMHREILNAPKYMDVDHIDRDGLNNQRNNLRICTRSQNNMNAKAWGKSKYRGVQFTKSGKNIYITAHIKINGKKMNLGSFKSEEMAALIYNEAAKKYFGKFARINKIG